MSNSGPYGVNLSTVRMRTIQPTDMVAVHDLHWNHYWRSHCLLLNPAFYRWQMEGPPSSAAVGGDQSVVAVDERGRLLSYVGLVPMPASFRGRTLRGAHVISWLSAPEARGQGLGKVLVAALIDRFDFVFARSPRPASLAILQRLGFRYFRNCMRWVAVLDAEAALQLAVDPSEASARRARLRAERTEAAGHVHAGAKCPAGAESLARTVLADSTTFERTRDYFAWRYENHPVFHYVFVWLGTASPEGVAVVRVEDVSGRPGRVLRVVEFLAGPARAPALARAVFAYGREQGCAYADAFGMSERFVAGMVASGAFNTLEEPDLRLPHLLRPWDPDLEPPGLLFFGRRDAGADAGFGPVDDLTGVHVSRGDGNMDWPSWVSTGSDACFAPPTMSGGRAA
jgi:GNAT superfamily N-acetyltransferase